MEFPIKSVFLALPLEGQPKQLFQELQEKLAPYADILRFQNPHSPHLTLMFWPEVSELEYKGIAEQAAKIASRHQAFTIDVIGADTFGSPSYAEASAGRRGEDRVLYLSVAFSDALARIKKDCPWSDGKPLRSAHHPRAHTTSAEIRCPQKENYEDP